jgi:alkylated DNA repair dioxygenase AlkB
MSVTASSKETITLTFGDCAENHRGMQALGHMAAKGLTPADIVTVKTNLEAQGITCELYDLSLITKLNPHLTTPAFPQAHLLVARKGLTALIPDIPNPTESLYTEQCQFPRDTKALMYGRVVNKKARHNLCFSDMDQQPDYASGKGTVINFTRTPILNQIRTSLSTVTGISKLDMLQCEANYYYDISKTYIGFHGDTERRIVTGIRLGATFPLHYQWFHSHQPVSTRLTIQLNDGDVYFMDEKAVGFDWKSGSLYTLRHAAGEEKNLK